MKEINNINYGGSSSSRCSHSYIPTSCRDPYTYSAVSVSLLLPLSLSLKSDAMEEREAEKKSDAMEEREEAEKMETRQRLFKILEAVNRVSRDLPDSDSSTIKALLELRTVSSSIHLPFSLSQTISRLVDLVQELHNSKPSKHGLISFVAHRVRSHEVSRLAADVESELQSLIDRESVSSLQKTLSSIRCSSLNSPPSFDVEKLFNEITALQERLSQGFDIHLQDFLLKSGVFAELEWILCNPLFSQTIRDKAAVAMKELVLFNKDVFVGSMLVGGSVKALVSMNSSSSLQVLSSLIKAIKSPLVEEIESCGGIFKIVGYLSEGSETRVMAMNCLMEIGFFGRKEAVEAMIYGGLIKRLVELQRSDELPFARCVSRFAVQLEMGEGLRQREKRALKQVILNRVREACVSDAAECATIISEVLWGSSS